MDYFISDRSRVSMVFAMIAPDGYIGTVKRLCLIDSATIVAASIRFSQRSEYMASVYAFSMDHISANR